MFLTGCLQSAKNTEESNGMDNMVDSTGSENGENSNSEYIYDCEAPGYFSNLGDFYMFALTGSRDPSSYMDSYTAENVEWYANIDSDALLKIEDLFHDKRITEDVEQILIPYKSNCYQYELKSGIIINIEYDPQRFTSFTDMTEIVGDSTVKYVTEDSTNKFSLNAERETVYVKKVDGITINRQMLSSVQFDYYCFATIIDGYKIRIITDWVDKYSSQNEMMADPKNECIKAFFTDSELSGAIKGLKSCIGTKKSSLLDD